LYTIQLLGVVKHKKRKTFCSPQVILVSWLFIYIFFHAAPAGGFVLYIKRGNRSKKEEEEEGGRAAVGKDPAVN